MYIDHKYWNNYLGSTDDSLILADYLADKQKPELSLKEIFSDTGLDKLDWNFRVTEPGLEYKDREGREHEFYYAVDLITDLAALLLECSVSGKIVLEELSGYALQTAAPAVCITATAEEHKRLDEALWDFAAAPLAYDLSEMCPEEDMLEMAKICEALRKELYHHTEVLPQ